MSKTYKLFLILLGMWFGLTCFVDFMAVPTVFREVSSREEAGNIGMIVFTAINRLELVFCVVMLGCAFTFHKMVRYKKTLWLTLSSLVILIMTYNLHMTPQVRKQTMIMRDHDSESVEYKQAEKTHHFYHSLYRKTDGVKILILLFLMIRFSFVEKRDEEAGQGTLV